MAKYISGRPISADGDYDIDGLLEGRPYYFEVTYPSGVTATVVPKELGPDGATYQAMTEGGSDVSIAATGTDKSGRYTATSGTTRFTVSSLAGGSIYIKHIKISNGY